MGLENNQQQQEKFESWGLLELFGHTRLAGKISEQTVGGVHFLRIDIPTVGDIPEHTRFFTQGAIYGMTVLTEETAKALANRLQSRPVHAYEVNMPVQPPKPALPHNDDDDSFGF